MVKKKLAFDDIAYTRPSDILFLILTRVPVKSLLRFKSVCKAWNVMISDDEFRRTHRDQCKVLGREKLLLHKCYSNFYTNEFEFRDLETSQLVTIAKQVFPPEKFRKAIILCSCDGLLLLKNPGAYKVYVLWNPSTKEYQTLACPYFNLMTNAKFQVVVGCVMILVSMITSLYLSTSGIIENNGCWTEKAT
ncbi:hypothetical protein T459_07370 [Capsicum annuum]|uniref:F-box domain-containing protein n=1 Tax=Capsicum annuum TaxID=4072 RepID=A0A2G2ZTG0_CAPAN|nr:hypothetical protein T459_35689 [Capsicum annuum]PHT85264.1 hypothetical protein T459_07370 [Capsicum annuum]